MRLRILLALVVGCTVGCDTSGQRSTTGAGPGGSGVGPGGNNPFLGPFLISVEPSPLEISPGDEIRLIGINFSDSDDLASNQVTFAAGNQRVLGLPLDIDFSRDDANPANGRESALTVIVPGGISKGNIELLVDGVNAGAQGYDARPEVMAWTLGLDEGLPVLRWEPLLREFRAGSSVRIYGLNFNDLQGVQLEDSTGQQFTLLPENIERNPDPPVGTTLDEVRTGYSVISFNLANEELEFPFAFNEFRDNLKVTFVGATGESNVLEIPVISEGPSPSNPTIGAVISAIKVPTGARTGPVRIFYNMYDTVANANHRMEVFWEVDVPDLAGGVRTRSNLALPDITDPMHSGLTGVVPGSASMPSQHRLLPGFGGLRTYAWDVPHDLVFQELFERGDDGSLPPRYFSVRFRIRPVLENDNPDGTIDSETEAVSAQILYYNLEDREGDEVSDLRDVTVIETFESDANEDRDETTANFGPDENPGAIVGTFQALPDPFGEGTERLELLNTPQIRLPVDAVRQYYVFNTDTLTVIYKQITSDGGTPCDPTDDVLTGSEGVLLVHTESVGKESNEFHLGSLVIGEDVEVLVRGENPLILRLSGAGVEGGQPAFDMQSRSTLDLNGCDGEPGPRVNSQPIAPGRGGNPGAGGGRGGDGGRGERDDFIPAGTGGLGGGRGGQSTLAYDADISRNSAFWGAPGGGGGNRIAGLAGDGGNPEPARFQAPLGGDGGLTRGEITLNPLSPGSGGGGGGASAGTLENVGIPEFSGGAGGGGGGGAVRLVVNGSVLLDPSSTIQANGGAGGDALLPFSQVLDPPDPVGHASPGPGGGGSGGCVFIQANGTISVTCESIQVHGGEAGQQRDGAAALEQNQPPGSGKGGEGWIRLESQSGGAPTCTALFAETRLVAAAGSTGIDLQVESVEGFPGSGGTILLFAPEMDELLDEVTYVTTSDGLIQGTSRGASSPPLPVDTRVVLKGPVDGDSLSEGGIVDSPDELETGRGRDREIHIRFDPSIDPVTEDVLRDPETGKTLSIWTFDTDEGLLRRPNGNVLLETDAAETDPGLIDATRFSLDVDTTLRVVGTRALRIVVAGPFDAAGTIDISGAPGGLLQFERNEMDPLPGLGGAGGPGGGRGGDGGRTRFLALDGSGNPDLSNKDPANTLPIHGAPGQAPPRTPPDWDQTLVNFGGGHPANDLVAAPNFTRPSGGVTLRGQGCGTCTDSAGGGAGGGNREAGGNGSAVPSSEAEKLGGKAGSVFGVDAFRFDGVWPYGAIGGAGGGATPHVSGRYQSGIDEAGFRFPAGPEAAQHSPGTGGGGGGGVLHIVADSVIIRETGAILARGGDAYQSIDLGGNGGGGAGGNVFIQAQSGLTLVAGSRIDVAGGLANLPVPIVPGRDLPEYPGNIRLTPLGQIREVGGKGGDGAPGRVRLEGTTGSLVSTVGLNPSVSGGTVLIDTVPSVGVSKAIRLGFGPGRAASTHAFEFGASVTRYFEFGQPPSASSVVFWQGAEESLDIHGAPGPFSAESLLGNVDPKVLRGREFVRFIVHFLSNTTTQEVHSIGQLELSFQLPSGS